MKHTVYFLYEITGNGDLTLTGARKSRAAAVRYREESRKQVIICKTELDMSRQTIETMELLYAGGFRFTIENGRARVCVR